MHIILSTNAFILAKYKILSFGLDIDQEFVYKYFHFGKVQNYVIWYRYIDQECKGPNTIKKVKLFPKLRCPKYYVTHTRKCISL